ncbi:ADP-ribosylglycohydrolase family protein [Dactylosporangium sp. CA-152071]|uniref:ADP-ribosylglycohydrolase family protein n=1 Tax=Dactylosporangium sp. CA-152071 TaxID=3239933 RepID=UPI003D8C936A
MITDVDAATRSLHGTALGDAFGETWFFRPADQMRWQIEERLVPQGPWPWTDDTAMAVSLYQTLREHGRVEQDDLARRFADAYAADPYRNYGPSMHGVLKAIGDGEAWQTVTAAQFDGQGSWGNGAAMRVAPLGAWFADDLDLVVEQAALSAAVTHAHPEATAGAIAVAVAAALAARRVAAGELLPRVADRTPDSEVAARLRRLCRRPFDREPEWIAGEVGCGMLISAPDTVPYAIWCAARHLDDLAEALWATVSAGGDMDTTCAIVGGIVAARTGLDGVPAEWVDAREPLPPM